MIVLPLYACAPAEEPVMLMTANDLHYISPTLTGNGELFSKCILSYFMPY